MIEESGGRAVAVRCDVTGSEDVRAALQQAVNTSSGAGVAASKFGVVGLSKSAALGDAGGWEPPKRSPPPSPGRLSASAGSGPGSGG